MGLLWKHCQVLTHQLFVTQYADLNRSVDALNAWRNATMLKPDHSLAWNNMVILLDNTGKKLISLDQGFSNWDPGMLTGPREGFKETPENFMKKIESKKVCKSHYNFKQVQMFLYTQKIVEGYFRKGGPSQ